MSLENHARALKLARFTPFTDEILDTDRPIYELISAAQDALTGGAEPDENHVSEILRASAAAAEFTIEIAAPLMILAAEPDEAAATGASSSIAHDLRGTAEALANLSETILNLARPDLLGLSAAAAEILRAAARDYCDLADEYISAADKLMMVYNADEARLYLAEALEAAADGDPARAAIGLDRAEALDPDLSTAAAEIRLIFAAEAAEAQVSEAEAAEARAARAAAKALTALKAAIRAAADKACEDYEAAFNEGPVKAARAAAAAAEAVYKAAALDLVKARSAAYDCRYNLIAGPEARP